MEERVPYRLILILENIPRAATVYQVRLDGRALELTDDVPILAVNTEPGIHNIDISASPTVKESASFRVQPGQMVTKIFVRPTAHKIDLDIDIGLRSRSFQDLGNRTDMGAESQSAPARAPVSRRGIWAALLIFIFLLGLVGGLLLARAIWPTRTRTSGLTGPAQTTESPAPSESDFAVELRIAHRTIDDAGGIAVVITYAWTNNSGDTLSAADLFQTKAFQDGVQLDAAAIYDISLYDPTAFTRELRPGATLELQAAFRLTDERSDIEFEIAPLEDVSGAPVIEKLDPGELEWYF